MGRAEPLSTRPQFLLNHNDFMDSATAILQMHWGRRYLHLGI